MIEYNLSYTHFVAPSAWRNVDILVLIELVGCEFFIFLAFWIRCESKRAIFYGEFASLFYILA
ncbi:hypothetical protein [Helicobacter sp. 23-1045]